MAVRTSTQSGNTHSAPFAFGSTVNNGDQLVVSNSAHAVTFDQSCTLGISVCTARIQLGIPFADATGTGGSLPAGTYLLRIAPTGPNGTSSPGSVYYSIAITAGQKITITLPSVIDAGSTGYDIYLTQAGGAEHTERRYATNQTGTFLCSSANWEDGTVAYASAAPLPNGDAVGYGYVTGAITAHSGGFTVAAGVTLTLKGDFVHLGNLTLNAGSILEFDPASSPSAAAIYGVQAGTSYAVGTAKVIMRGNSGSRAEIRGKSGGGACRAITFTTQGVTGEPNPVRLDWQWFKVSNAGKTDIPAVWARCEVAYNQLLSDGIFHTDCKECQITGVVAGGGWDISRVAFRQTTGNTIYSRPVCLSLTQGADKTTGTRSVTDCAFEGLPAIVVAGGATFTRCYFNDGWDRPSFPLGGNTGSFGDLVGCFVRKLIDGATGAVQWFSGSNLNFTDCYLYIDNVTGPTALDLNPHGILSDPPGAGLTLNNTRWTIEYNADSGVGDMFGHNGTGSGTAAFYYCVTVPNRANISSGILWSMGNTLPSTFLFVAEHNTSPSDLYPVLSTSEGGQQPAGTGTSVKSNLVYSLVGTGNNRYILGASNADGSTDQTDIVAPANCDYNAGSNLLDVTGVFSGGYSWYDTKFSSAPNGHDVHLDPAGPQFVDATRKFIGWAVYATGISGTEAQKIQKGLDVLKGVADTTSADHVNGLLMTDPGDWVRAGFVVTNPALNFAAHDGTTIGAMPYVAPSAVPRTGGEGASNKVRRPAPWAPGTVR